jgi:hypothetical protein
MVSKGLIGLVRLGKLAIFDSGAVMRSDLAETCSVWRMVPPSPAIHAFPLGKLMNGLLDTAFQSASSRCSRTVCQGTSAKAVNPRQVASIARWFSTRTFSSSDAAAVALGAGHAAF